MEWSCLPWVWDTAGNKMWITIIIGDIMWINQDILTTRGDYGDNDTSTYPLDDMSRQIYDTPHSSAAHAPEVSEDYRRGHNTGHQQKQYMRGSNTPQYGRQHNRKTNSAYKNPRTPMKNHPKQKYKKRTEEMK